MSGKWVQIAWVTAESFVYHYPLFMSYLWMMGAALFYLRYERDDPPFTEPPCRPAALARRRSAS